MGGQNAYPYFNLKMFHVKHNKKCERCDKIEKEQIKV